MAAQGRATTDQALRDWTEGSPRAERLAAAILLLDGYAGIDPQHPFGGPDGRQDVLCAKGGRKFVAAVYFPNGDKTFSTVKRKFTTDLEGALRDGVDGIVFVTNQRLTRSQRTSLGKIAAKKGKICEPMHRERIRIHLDSPAGYGIRLEHLRIEMNLEEQFAYFAEAGGQVARALEVNTREIRRLAQLVEDLGHGQERIEQTMALLSAASSIGATLLAQTPDLAKADPHVTPVSHNMTIGFVLAVHRLSCTDAPAQVVGQLRTIPVWIAGLSERPDEKQPQPIPPQEVRKALEQLLMEWNEKFSSLSSANVRTRLEAIAKFHADFQHIHPFVDGNGRAGRAILIQQCIDLFGQADPGLLERGAAYQEAVREGVAGELVRLIDIIEQVISG